MSGTAAQSPGRWVWKRVRGGDLLRGVIVPPGKTRGRCLREGCAWPGPVGTTPHNISRELMRHTRKTGHRTRFIPVEIVDYAKPGTGSGRPENPS